MAATKQKAPQEHQAHGAAEGLRHMTVAQLREIAKERELPGRASMNKQALIDALLNTPAGK